MQVRLLSLVLTQTALVATALLSTGWIFLVVLPGQERLHRRQVEQMEAVWDGLRSRDRQAEEILRQQAETQRQLTDLLRLQSENQKTLAYVLKELRDQGQGKKVQHAPGKLPDP